MRLLLDTHAFIWWDNRTHLSTRALAACLDPANTRSLSIVSIWELQIKIQLGKLTLRLPLADVLRDQQNNGLQIEPLSVDDVLVLAQLPPHHRDPFDRALVAQARRGGFHLVSGDPQIALYNVPVLW